MVNIDKLTVGQHVQLDGERGKIREIDYDKHLVWCTVKVRNGEAMVDVDPDEPWFEVIT